MYAWKIYSLVWIIMFPACLLGQPCPITIDAGTDMAVCWPGGPIQLNGSVSGQVLTYSWSPPAGLSDPFVLNPLAAVFSTTTYTLTAQAVDPNTNLIINGNFEAGNTGFTSGYTYSATNLFPEGVYTVTNNPNSVHSSFSPCGDHTSGSGQMMVINGASTPNINVWCQTIPILPNTNYAFGTWVTSVYPVSPAQLQFSINGQLLGAVFSAPSSTCVWQQFYELWNSGGATSATICIVNQNTQPTGNDFALDDITFNPICEVSDDVTIEIVQLNALANPVEFITCDENGGPGMQLDGSGSSSGQNITYNWVTFNGNILSGANTLTPTVNAPGTYTLTVTFDDGITTCMATTYVEVLEDPNVPFAYATAIDEINCYNLTITVLGYGSSEGSNITYQWTESDGGNILTGENTLTPIVDAMGTYTILVTNTDNGCTAEASVFVNENLEEPTAVAQVSGQLDCIITTLFLDGLGSSEGSEFEYEWTTDDGNILSGENTLSPEIDAAGTFILTVTNTQNGCTAEAEVIVIEDTGEPTVSILPPEVLTCDSTEIILDATGSNQDSIFSYEWTTNDGNIISGENSLEPKVNSEGTYILTITNEDNGCTAEGEETVSEDLDPPEVLIDDPVLLNCMDSTVVLDATDSSQGSIFSYEWTTDDGNILTGENSIEPTVIAPGTYTLTIRNTDNGCTAESSVEVFGDSEFPIADAGPPDTLDCLTTSLELDGMNSSQGANFDYQWTTGDGNITFGETTLNPEVDAAGTYELLVTNINNGCTSIASVTITQNDNIPIAEAYLNDTLTCDILSLTIDGSGSTQGANISFEWTTPDGNFESGDSTLTPSVNAPGTYFLTIYDHDNDCQASTSVTVEQDITPPEAEAGPTFTLTCDDPQFSLDPAGSSSGPNFDFDWTTPDGNFVNPPDSMTPDVDAPGTYFLTIINLDNGCVASDSVVIGENTKAPISEIAKPGELTCSVTTLILDGQNSSQGNNFQYQWTTQIGNILTGAATLVAEINESGIYDLLITDTDNGCTAISNVEVFENTDYPMADAGGTLELNCYFPEITLAGNGSTGDEFSYQWTTQIGNILSGAKTLSPEVSAPGIYELTVTNEENDCVSTDSVKITQNTSEPNAEAGSPFILSCSLTSATLDGTGSETGGNIEYLWTTQNGNILSGATTLFPEINAPGIYTLTVTDIENGCSATDEVEIGQDADAPVADAGTAGLLTCAVNSVPLDGTNSSQGNEFAYQWVTNDGNILSGATTLNPEVNAPGTYFLTVTNLDNNCENLSSVTVGQNITPPVADAGTEADLTCAITSLNLDGTASDLGSDFQYSWTTIDGNILFGANTMTPEIDAPGIYELTVLNTQNGCESADFVTIGQNTIPPSAVAAVSGDLTCVVGEVTVSGAGSSVGNDFSYEWSTPTGNIVSGGNALIALVNAPGVYEIVVTDNANGCVNVASVEVFENKIPPVASAEVNDILTCQTWSLILDGQNSSQGSQFSYLWTTQNGNILSGATTVFPEVNQPGIYQILVTDQINGCTATDFVEVSQDVTPPVVLISEPDILTCVVGSVVLDGNGSSQGANFEYQWTTQNGNFLSGATTLNPEVNAPGTYLLTVSNNQNGCSEDSQIVVEENTQAPIADAGEAFVLNCFEEVQFLDGTASQSGPNIHYEWTTADGDLVSDLNTATPGISSGGTYHILVTDLDNGCSATDAVTIPEDAPTAIPELTQPLCFGDKGAIDIPHVSGGTQPYRYSIDGENFGSNSFFPNLEPGNYDIVVQDANGCEHRENDAIIQPVKVEIFVEPEVEIEMGDSYQISAQTNIPAFQISEILWSPSEGLSCADCLNPIATPMETTLYRVTVRNTENCEDEAPILVRVSHDIHVFIPNVFSPNGDGVNDIFLIFAKDESVSEINSFVIFNRWGESVFSDFHFQPNDPAHGWDGSHRGKDLDPAVFAYFAEIEFVDGRVTLFKGDVVLTR